MTRKENALLGSIVRVLGELHIAQVASCIELQNCQMNRFYVGTLQQKSLVC